MTFRIRKAHPGRRSVRALKALGLAATLSVAASAAGCTASPTLDEPKSDGSSAQVFPASEVQPLVDGIVHEPGKDLKVARLAEGLVPPTNRWFGGLVFGDKPEPVFPLPLTFGLTDSGFAFGQPTVTATEKTISGGFTPDVAVDVGAAGSRVSAYDTATVTTDSLDGSGAVLGRTVLGEGWPFVSYTAERAGTVRTGLPFTATGDFWTATAGSKTYGLVVTDGSVNGTDVRLDKGGTATWFVVPADGSAEQLAGLAAHRLRGSSVSYQVDGDTVTTTLRYQTDGGDTALAAMPHQQQGLASDASCGLGSYPSAYGTLRLCAGTELTWTTPTTTPRAALDLDGLSEGDKRELITQVTQDAAALPDFPADTYFGGKALYRAAMLYQLATQLGAEQPAESVRVKLTAVMEQWMDPQGCAQRDAFCFVYDDRTKGLIGHTPSFGSDEYNDHHFHYGYFLYAAGVLAAEDKGLVDKYAPVMNLLAADIGSSAASGLFPDRRNFDVYAGHSWAAGTPTFADGNNQESSSEAVTAYTGLALWGKASGNAALATEATWMVSTEAQAGLAYWTNFDASDPAYRGYGHRIVSLNWGGKRDYATWFSPEPAAMLGILLIPMSPSSTYLADDPERIDANVSEATGGGKYDQQFGDYLLMYSALAGDQQRKAALEKARTLDAKWIDNANSRSYMLAWLMLERTR